MTRRELTADGRDLSYITAKIVDKDGNLCPDAENELTFNHMKAGELTMGVTSKKLKNNSLTIKTK